MSREIIGLSKPQQTVLVSLRGDFELMGKRKEYDNLITVDWHMPTSFNPPLYIISIGKTRFSLNLIKNSRVFAVNFMTFLQKDAVLYCGQNTGLKVDKFHETKLTKEECSSIDCPYIKEAAAVYECEVVDEFETGDHIIFVGKIINTRNNNSEKRLLHTSGIDFTTTNR